MSELLHPPPRTRKPRGQGASRRGEILAAATRIFLSDGVAHATMRRIAAAVGVSSTALYVYFPDKDAILQAIAKATFIDLVSALEASQSGADGHVARLRAGLRAYVAFGLGRPDAYRLTFRHRTGMHKVGRPKTGMQQVGHGTPADRSFAILRRNVEAMAADGVFRTSDPVAVAEAIWAAIHGVTMLLLDQSEQCETPPERLVVVVVEMILSGVISTEHGNT
ncbi:TetR/AcrR family transcriptional regulator [Lichenicoccus sp.]|uniref:TetR/AcrR family transcriptional regulator n=1 Tax=Lichenicoccus sp. TaxID=2781899 RepID=UPI003D0A7A8A